MSLSFTPVLKSGLVLIPGDSHVLEMIFENDTEYDKQLFCTLRSPDGLLLSRNHFDVLVPAEGKCIETIKITVPENLRIFYDNYFFVLETTDSVLEEDKNFAFFLKCALPWKWEADSTTGTTSGIVFMGNTHVCTCNADRANTSFTLTALLACAENSSAALMINSTENCEVLLNSALLGTYKGDNNLPLSLIKGINTVVIKTREHECYITAKFIQNGDYIPACINPESI